MFVVCQAMWPDSLKKNVDIAIASDIIHVINVKLHACSDRFYSPRPFFKGTVVHVKRSKAKVTVFSLICSSLDFRLP